VRPNVLWLQFDELRADALGCYGHDRWPGGQSPVIDQLAEEGTRFTNTFVNSPVCVPSRASMLTGRYPSELGILHNDNVWPNKPAEPAHARTEPTWPAALRAGGYATYSLGKSHVPLVGVWQDERAGGDEGYKPFKYRPDRKADDAFPHDLRMITLPGSPRVVIAGQFPDSDSRQDPTEQLTSDVCELIQERAHESAPWLIRASYIMPHTPVLPPARLIDALNPADFTVVPELDHPGEDRERAPWLEQLALQSQEAHLLSAQDVAFARLCYWAMIAHIDRQVERLLDALSRAHLTEQTIVVLDSDHGTMLGEHGLWQKQMFHRSVHRVPQIFRWPGMLPDHCVREDLNELRDRGRTITDLCGVAAPSAFGGRSLFAEGTNEPEAIFGEIGYGAETSRLYPLPGLGPIMPRVLSIRTKDFRYEVASRYRGKTLSIDDEESHAFMADLSADPDEQHNVAGSPEYRAVENHFRTLAARHSQMCEPAVPQ
jgi:choline-sulfatase